MVPSRQWDPPQPCLSVLTMDPQGILGIGAGGRVPGSIF